MACLIHTAFCACLSNNLDVDAHVRLSHGSYGLVEVYYNGTWGTVCDDDWDINDGNVVCRELGYERATSVYYHAAYGRVTGTIWMDNIACSGLETRLSNCSFNGWGNHNCGHSEDASVECLMEGEKYSLKQRAFGDSFPLLQCPSARLWCRI